MGPWCLAMSSVSTVSDHYCTTKKTKDNKCYFIDYRERKREDTVDTVDTLDKGVYCTCTKNKKNKKRKEKEG